MTTSLEPNHVLKVTIDIYVTNPALDEQWAVEVLEQAALKHSGRMAVHVSIAEAIHYNAVDCPTCLQHIT